MINRFALDQVEQTSYFYLASVNTIITSLSLLVGTAVVPIDKYTAEKKNSLVFNYSLAYVIHNILFFILEKVYWVILHVLLSSAVLFLKSTFSKNYFRNTIRLSNSLDPDQGSNCLQRL